MALKEQLARIFAAVVFIALFAVPSFAWAHEGHAHHASVAVKATTSSKVAAKPKSDAVTQVDVSFVKVNPARRPDLRAASLPTDCGSHCCGGAVGMACCGAALAPDTCCDPFIAAVAGFVLPHLPPLPGITPEALPKPPKSFA